MSHRMKSSRTFKKIFNDHRLVLVRFFDVSLFFLVFSRLGQNITKIISYLLKKFWIPLSCCASMEQFAIFNGSLISSTSNVIICAHFFFVCRMRQTGYLQTGRRKNSLEICTTIIKSTEIFYCLIKCVFVFSTARLSHMDAAKCNIFNIFFPVVSHSCALDSPDSNIHICR